MCLELCFPFPPGTSQDSQGEGVAPVWGGEGTGPGMGSATSGRCDSMGFSLAAAPGKGGGFGSEDSWVHPAFPFCKPSSWWAPCPRTGCLSSRGLFGHLLTMGPWN